MKAKEKVGKRPTLNAERSTLNSDRASWTLGAERLPVRLGPLGVFPLLRPARLASILLFLVAGCASTMPPPVTPEMAARNPSKKLTVEQLEHGRRLFASRCIECHTLPPVNAHAESEWPGLIGWMAKRASLKPDEREAVIAYILAARAQESGKRPTLNVQRPTPN